MRNRLLLFIAGTFLAINLQSQELPEIIPPSPEAVSIIQSGNSPVNYYTGQPSLSIPLHTVQSRGYQFPVSLSYVSFQGIGVESIAPWVGLGWALNATGSVSRSIRDLPDDETIKGTGYIYLSQPDVYDPVEMLGYTNGSKDKEPDKFHFNFNGLSGSFFLGREGTVIQKSKSNIHIEYTKTTEIDEFTIIDNQGFKYVFNHKERTQSLGQSQSPSDVPNGVTSWYIDRVLDSNGNVLLSFSYYDLANLRHTTFTPQAILNSNMPFSEEQNMTKSWHTTQAKRIKEISYPGGYVRFNISTDARIDYLNDKYLESIEVVAPDSTTILKKFKLGYSYFGQDGIYPIDHEPSYPVYNYTASIPGDYFKRLKLDQVQEFNGSETASLPPYSFEYYQGNLPHRYSYAIDHWGFYNGEESNTSPEPVSRLNYFTIENSGPNGTWVPVEKLALTGDANREANPDYGKFSVLRKITYPTGGYTEFELEANTAVSDELPNNKEFVSVEVPINNQPSSVFNVELEVDAFAVVRMMGLIPEKDCNIVGAFYDANTDEEVENVFLEFGSNGNLLGYDDNIFLRPGSYYTKFQYQTGGGCTYSGPIDKLTLSFENEVETNVKYVGGQRIKSIKDHDGISSANDVIRYFYYGENGESGNSTGRLVTIPRYFYQEIYTDLLDPPFVPTDYKPIGYVRALTPLYPLMSTSGSMVGYKKVTEVRGDAEVMGKTVYEYTSPEDYPNLYDAYFFQPLSGENQYQSTYFPTGKLSIYPFAQADDRDFLRGLLKKQTNYAWNGTSFEKVSETENTYQFNFAIPLSNEENNGQNPPQIDGYTSVTGLRVVTRPSVEEGSPPGYQAEWYNIYSGRIDLKQTVSRQYDMTDPSDPLEITTINYWDDLSLDSGYYNISRSTTVGSDGILRETKNTFAYNAPSWLNTIVTNELKDRNMLATVLEQKTYKGSMLLSVVRNFFNEFNTDQLYQSKVDVAKGDDAPETRVNYHSYDNLGNPTEVSKEGGIRISYIWGYDNTMPVIQGQNISSVDLNSAVQSAINAWTSKPGSVTDLESLLMYVSDMTSLTHKQVWAEFISELKSQSSITSLVPFAAITYKIGVGVTSQTDSNGETVYYEYDSFNRLKLVRDDEGNILKSNTYHYKNN
ncbi:hypothetical protein [Roseivirga sp.]|uniref:hypothetical protein n=1 Tax=Roseivirga sp. TaxID=1964215 RepID=UPI003B51797E